MFVLIIADGWGTSQRGMQSGYGEETSAKQQILHLIRSIRTVTRCKFLMHTAKYLHLIVNVRV